MKRYRFELEHTDFYCIARDFRSACTMFDSAGLDPHAILSIEERTK
jgi:hypothetical protein